MKKCIYISDYCEKFMYLLKLTRPSDDTVRSYKSKMKEFKAFLDKEKITKLKSYRR